MQKDIPTITECKHPRIFQDEPRDGGGAWYKCTNPFCYAIIDPDDWENEHGKAWDWWGQMSHKEITKEIWEDANNQWVVVTIWTPKPGKKRQTPTVKVAGDYPSYAKAQSVKKKMERRTDSYYSPERRTIFVARKFDVSKLDIFDSYSYPYVPNEPKESDGH